MSAELNRVAWSSYDPATGDYSLMSRFATGEITRLPVAPRKVPLDVDLGYLGEGAEVAADSRCTLEARLTGGGSAGLLPNYALGKGCDIYLFDFDAQREVKYAPTTGGNASEFLPTASPASRIAFARVYDFGWDWPPSGRGIHASDIRVDVVRGSHRTLQSVRLGLVARALFSPSIVVRRMLWGRTLVAGNGGRSDFLYDKGSVRGRTLHAQGPNFLASVSGVPSRGGIYYLTTQNPTASGPAEQAPACGAPAETYPVGRTDPLTFGS